MPSNCVCFGKLAFQTENSLIYIFIGRKAANSIRAVNRMASLAHSESYHGDLGKAQMRADILNYKEESERVCWLFLLHSSIRLIAFA